MTAIDTTVPTSPLARDIARLRRTWELLDASLRSIETKPGQPADKVDNDLRTLAEMCSDLRVQIERVRREADPPLAATISGRRPIADDFELWSEAW